MGKQIRKKSVTFSLSDSELERFKKLVERFGFRTRTELLLSMSEFFEEFGDYVEIHAAYSNDRKRVAFELLDLREEIEEEVKAKIAAEREYEGFLN